MIASSCGGLSVTVATPRKRRVATSFPFRSRSYSVQSTWKDCGDNGTTLFTSTLMVVVFAFSKGEDALNQPLTFSVAGSDVRSMA